MPKHTAVLQDLADHTVQVLALVKFSAIFCFATAKQTLAPTPAPEFSRRTSMSVTLLGGLDVLGYAAFTKVGLQSTQAGHTSEPCWPSCLCDGLASRFCLKGYMGCSPCPGLLAEVGCDPQCKAKALSALRQASSADPAADACLPGAVPDKGVVCVADCRTCQMCGTTQSQAVPASCLTMSESPHPAALTARALPKA